MLLSTLSSAVRVIIQVSLVHERNRLSIQDTSRSLGTHTRRVAWPPMKSPKLTGQQQRPPAPSEARCTGFIAATRVRLWRHSYRSSCWHLLWSAFQLRAMYGNPRLDAHIARVLHAVIPGGCKRYVRISKCFGTSVSPTYNIQASRRRRTRCVRAQCRGV